jgi:hypothetical protein
LIAKAAEAARAASRDPNSTAIRDESTAMYLAGNIADQRTAEAHRFVVASTGPTDFMGIAFGGGVGVRFSGSKRIVNAEKAADGTVRVTETDSQKPIAILESHWLGACRDIFQRCTGGTYGVGPFFGIVANDDKLVSFALGAMVGFKTAPKKVTADEVESGGFSMGFGAILESGVKSLAAGFTPGKPLPAGESDVKFKTESRWGGLLFFTRTF